MLCLWGNPPHACVRQTTCVLPLHACHFLDTARTRCLWPQAGSEAAARQVASREAEKRQESASAALGMRRGLSLDVGADSSAAELLLSADAMLEACPDLEAAKCARVDAKAAYVPAHVLVRACIVRMHVLFYHISNCMSLCPFVYVL